MEIVTQRNLEHTITRKKNPKKYSAIIASQKCTLENFLKIGYFGKVIKVGSYCYYS
jgi:hypothetical protein